jgi:hypothetical protein
MSVVYKGIAESKMLGRANECLRRAYRRESLWDEEAREEMVDGGARWIGAC